MGASVLYHYWTSVPNPKSVTKFGGVSTTLAALLLLGIAPTIPRRRALPAPPIHPRLWQRTSGPGHERVRQRADRALRRSGWRTAPRHRGRTGDAGSGTRGGASGRS